MRTASSNSPVDSAEFAPRTSASRASKCNSATLAVSSSFGTAKSPKSNAHLLLARSWPLVLGLIAFAGGCRTASKIHSEAIEHNQYGVKYLEEGNLDKAQQRFELALEYNADFPEAHSNMCVVWFRRGNLDKAKEFCIKALRFNNDLAQAHNVLGNIYMKQSSFGRAHDSFKAALRVDPAFVEARYNLCLTYLRLKRGPDARVCYEKIIEVNSRVADPYHDLCILDIDEKDFPSAVERCTKAIDLEPKFADAYYHLGRAYQGGGKHCEAVEAYKGCIAIEDGNAECRNNLASAVRHCALQAPQLKDVEGAGEGGAAASYKRGLAQRERGLLPEAEREFKKCIKLDGHFGLCYCALADMKRRVSENNEARKLCRKCVSYTSEEQTSPEYETCARSFKSEE